MMPAARKYQKFCARADISAGKRPARMSKIRVVRRRPSLSVITPLRNARMIWKPQLMLRIRPICVSVKPKASI